MLETMAAEVEKFCQDVAKDFADAADTLIELSDEVADQIHQAIAPALDEIDEQLREWFEPFLISAIDELETTFFDVTAPVSHTVEPLINQHPTCVGCRYYHGQVYNGVMLVCGMHPYGVEGDRDTCPDKELH